MYADDALLIGRTEKDIVSKVNVYKAECRMGLEVNMDKSEVMIVGSGDGCESKIAGFEVKKEIKYLGGAFAEKMWRD